MKGEAHTPLAALFQSAQNRSVAQYFVYAVLELKSTYFFGNIWLTFPGVHWTAVFN